MPGPPITDAVVPPAALDGVVAIVLHRVRLPLREPFVAAHGTEHDREVVLVEVVPETGASGWGECSALSQPTYTPEYTDGAWHRLRDGLVPGALAGRRLAVGDAPMAWTALGGALTDRHLRATGRSLSTAIGGRRTEIEATAVIGGQPSVGALVDRVGARLDEGYRSVKVKIAPGADLDRLTALRRAFPAVPLAADANGTYFLDEPADVDTLAAIDQLGLWYLEQPLAPERPDDLVRLAARFETPIALDESIASAAVITELAGRGGPFVVNLKPARVGGLDAARACVAAAAGAGWPVFVGGMLETGVGRALALAVASWPDCGWPTDLGPSERYFAEDVTEPIELLAGGRLAVPRGPGLGVTPWPERLAAVTVDRVELRP